MSAVVRRHLAHPFRRPYADHTVAAFRALRTRVEAHAGPLILDAGCGAGESTRRLARCHPRALLIGVDKSAHRLAKTTGDAEAPANCVFVRADLIDFWRLAAEAGWRPWRQYLLYPNPWPKPAHLQRRWHGSPVFPALLALGGRLELRSNWEIYVREFALALRLAGRDSAVTPLAVGEPMTPFERKYVAAGQPLWRCVAD